ESRNQRLASSQWPYLARSTDPKSALLLLQMAGITNAGGYFLRLDQATAIVPVRLWVCVWLNGPGHDTAPLPSAANAIAYTGNTPPSVVRFEGPEHIQVTPYAPPGFLAFGW